MAKARDEEGSGGPLGGAEATDQISHSSRIINASEAIDDAVGRLYAAVQRARDDGQSWSQIGRALGITRQAAHERFGPGVSRPFRARRR